MKFIFAQISACCNDENFNQYIIPTKNIERSSSKINKFEIKIVDGERKLYHDRKEVVEALGPKEGLTNFLNFLKELQTDPSNEKGEVLLVAHYCFKYVLTIYTINNSGRTDQKRKF